ncbi:hypothetical protein NC991_17830 [Funiculus sociatus GB1-A4]
MVSIFAPFRYSAAPIPGAALSCYTIYGTTILAHAPSGSVKNENEFI